jgi:hypothetical protein
MGMILRNKVWYDRIEVKSKIVSQINTKNINIFYIRDNFVPTDSEEFRYHRIFLEVLEECCWTVYSN